MLDVANLGAQSADYYLREVAESRELYYSGHGEAPGRWVGAAAERLGLTGQVSPEAFKAMFAGLDPASGEQLGRATSRTNGRPAFDLVFRPVKSVSVLWAKVNDVETQQAIKAAHDLAVGEALVYLEQQVGTRRGAQGAIRIAGRGLLAAAYDHRQSRAGDPLLHTHVIVANRIQGADGRWTTIDGRDLYHEALGAGAIYEMVYRGALTRSLGVEWVRSPRGQWEIAGIPDEVLQHYSKRREAIELRREAREARGEAWSPKVAQWVASATRPEKEHVGADVLRERWQGDDVMRTFEAGAVLGRTSGRDVAAVSGQSRAERAELFARMSGPDGLTADKATFAMRDVLAFVREGGASVSSTAEADELVRTYLASAEVVPVAVGDRKLYTTAELAALERRLLEGAQARQGCGVAVVRPADVRAALAAAPTIGEDQAQLVRDVTGDGHGVSVAVGRAGSGKTFALRVAADAWRRSGVRVSGAAPTGIAATELEHAAGVEASTVDALLAGLASGRSRLERGQVLLLDEAGMVGTRKLDQVLGEAAKVGAKVVLVGDDRQLQAVLQAGGAFKALRQRLGASELTVNRRQRDPLDREALEAIRDGRGEEALRLYGAGGRLRFARTEEQADRAMLADWWASFGRGERSVMLTLTRQDADRLNDLARDVMRQAGRLGVEEFEVGGRRFAVGDRIVMRKNWKPLGVANGTRGTVEAFSRERGELLVRTDEGEHVTLPRFYLAKEGAGGGPSVNHAYATTTHRTQALTVDRAFVRGGGAMTSEWSYVAMSRVRMEARIYAVDPERATADGIDLDAADRADPRAQMAAGMSRSAAQVLALDSEQGRALRHLTVGELRAERDRLGELLAGEPRSRAAEARLLAARRERAEAELAEAEKALQDAQEALRRIGGSWRSRSARQAAERAVDAARGRVSSARRNADRALDRERPVTEHERKRRGWIERNAPDVERFSAVVRELAERKRLGARAQELDPPAWLAEAIGRPSVEWSPGRRQAWRDAAAAIDGYRGRFGIDDQTRALGEAPRDLERRAAWKRAQQAIEAARSERPPARAVGQDRGVERGRGREMGRAREPS